MLYSTTAIFYETVHQAEKFIKFKQSLGWLNYKMLNESKVTTEYKIIKYSFRKIILLKLN